MQGSRTVDPFMASTEDTLPVETSSPPTLHTPEPGKKGNGKEKKQQAQNILGLLHINKYQSSVLQFTVGLERIVGLLPIMS